MPGSDHRPQFTNRNSQHPGPLRFAVMTRTLFQRVAEPPLRQQLLSTTMGSLGKTDERELIAQSLRGQRFFIPDMYDLFRDWPMATNASLPALHEDIEKTLACLFPPGRRRSKLRIADPALFAAMWWPHASFDRLCTAAYLSLWLFAWDDETDTCELSDLSKNFEEAQAFRTATLVRIRDYLGLEVSPTDLEKAISVIGSRNAIMELFEPAGRSIREHCGLEEKRMLLKQIEFFVEMSTLEQKIQLSGHLPTVQSYQQRRMGSSAVFVCLAIHEYTLEMQLSRSIRENPLMKSIWDQTNIIISVSNDILSVKKEIAQNQVDSLIPLLYISHLGNAQDAMDEAIDMLRNAIYRLDLSAAALLEELSGDKIAQDQVASFIDSCREACTANLEWSLVSGRYKLDAKRYNGGFVFSV